MHKSLFRVQRCIFLKRVEQVEGTTKAPPERGWLCTSFDSYRLEEERNTLDVARVEGEGVRRALPV